MSKAEDLVSEVVLELRSRCQCEFTSDKITGGGFLCFPDSPQHVTYRGTIHGTLLASTSQLLGNLEEWILSGTSISIQAQLLSPDVTCAVSISSRNEDECRPQLSSTEQSTAPSTDPSTVPSAEPSTIPITWIVVGVVVAMIVGLVMMIVMVAFLIHRCNKTSALKLHKDLKM